MVSLLNSFSRLYLIYINRFQNIAQKVEQALNGKEQTVSIDAPAPAYDFALSATKQIWAAVWSCWDSNIFLPSLVDRFLGLSLQIIARYKSWVEFGLQLMNPELQNVRYFISLTINGGNSLLA